MPKQTRKPNELRKMLRIFENEVTKHKKEIRKNPALGDSATAREACKLLDKIRKAMRELVNLAEGT